MIHRKMFNRRDVWLFTGLALLALLAYAWRGGVTSPGGERFAQVTIGRQVVWTAPLSTSTAFVPDHANLRLWVGDGKAGFVSSDCPDQTCVRSGFLTQPGQMAICLPNRTALLIVGEPGLTYNDADTFAY